MKIALLGSSFDPPHIGHLLIAQQVKEILKIDEVWLMPAYQHAFGKKLTDKKHRLAMVKLVQSAFIKVSELEIKRGGISYAIDTLQKLHQQYSDNTFFWILGSDQLDEFHKYKDWKEIVNNYSLIVFPRESVLNQRIEKVKHKLRLTKVPKNIIVMNSSDLILTNISSSAIRQRIKKGLSIKHLVTEQVEEYIRKHKLYM